MIIGVVKDVNDVRNALVPQVVKKYLTIDGVEVYIEEGFSEYFQDNAYIDAGAKVVNRIEVLQRCDFLLGIYELKKEELSFLKKGATMISHLDPYNNKDYLDKLNTHCITSISMEMIPRTTIAQKMDALSSQASIAGYEAVIQAAYHLPKIFPMMMTPSGTIPPAKVFVIGAGVAGLQAIATAKRLGAKVEAFDTRPVVEQQVQSLGAKFIKVDLGKMSQTGDGYATQLTDDQLQMQQLAMEKACCSADVVITTAKLFGKKAPILITHDVLLKMKEGSVIIDLAAGTGGNVEGTKVDEIITIAGVKIIGVDNLASKDAIDASTMYANNIYNLLDHIYDKEAKMFNFEDEIIKATMITKNGSFVNQRIIDFYKEGA